MLQGIQALLLMLILGGPSAAHLAPSQQGAVDQAQRKRPNVLFISVDDLRPQFGSYGHAEVYSPNMDRLAARGTQFQRAYCNVPVCGPSRVSVLTGLRTNSNQWRTGDIDSAFTTLPMVFRSQGYVTLSNGKVLHHMQDRAEDWSEAPWRSAEIYHGDKDWANYNAYGLWKSDASGEHIHPDSKRGPYFEAADVPDNAYQDGMVADKTIADLKRLQEAGDPFFLACGFWRPHLPFNAPKKYWDLYERDEIVVASNQERPEDLPTQCTGSGEIDRYALAGKRKQEQAFHREARHAYYASVSYVDAQIGRVVDALDSLGLAENTIIVLWGDHGWNLGEHGFWGKHNTLENSVHAPLIVCAPGASVGSKTEALVEFIDIYPSLCELADIPLPDHLEGTSFVPILQDPEQPGKSAVFINWSGCKAVRTDRYLYTEWRRSGEVIARMLFDHHLDPMENTNIAEDPEAQTVVDSLAKLLK
ncbi:MAG: iduronate 2-sulfatase [Planctomycetota bacterium]|jgi:iduronate 2-sulfatase